MSKYPRVTEFLRGPALASAVAVLTASLGSSAQTQVPAMVNATIADPAKDIELRGAAFSADGALVHVVVGRATEGRASSTDPLLWATVDETGRVARRDDTIQLTAGATVASTTASSAPVADPTRDGGLVVRPDGSPLIVHAAFKGQLQLVPLGTQNIASGPTSVSVGTHTPTIRRVIPITQGRVALLGAIGAAPLFAVLEPDARTVMVRASLPAEEMTLVGASFDPDGSSVVVGEKGTFPDSTTWVARLSVAGAVVMSRNLSGRPLDIARGADGTTILILQRGTMVAAEIVLQVLATDLTPRSDRVLAANQRYVQSFRAAAVPSGGFVLAGVKDRGRWLSRITAAGAEVWTDAQDPRTRKDLEMVSSIELLAKGDTFVAAYTAFVVEERQQKKVVRVTRFRVS